MNGSPASVLIRTLPCFAAGWESGTATSNGSRRIVSIQNVCSLRNEGNRINPTLNGLSSTSSGTLVPDISESSTITSQCNRQYFRRTLGRIPKVADEWKPITKQPLWPLWVRRADSTAFSVWRKIRRASSRKT